MRELLTVFDHISHQYSLWSFKTCIVYLEMLCVSMSAVTQLINLFTVKHPILSKDRPSYHLLPSVHLVTTPCCDKTTKTGTVSLECMLHFPGSFKQTRDYFF